MTLNNPQVEVDGSLVTAIALKEPIGQFTHWYVNSDKEPRFLIINEAQPVPPIESLNEALVAAQASGRFLVAVFTITGDVEKGEQQMKLHRISHEFPFDAFAACKREFGKNLDDEFRPPQPLRMADITKKAIGQTIEGSTADQSEILEALTKMNQQIDAAGIDSPVSTDVN